MTQPAPPTPELTPKRLAEAIKALTEDQVGADNPRSKSDILAALSEGAPEPLRTVLQGVACAFNRGEASASAVAWFDDADPAAQADLVFELIKAKRATIPAVIAHMLRKWPHKAKKRADDE